MSLRNNPCSSGRDDVADIAKGIGIIFVVAGHCKFELPDFLAYSFHMPLFFFISGFFISSFINDDDASIWQFLRKRFIRLMIPFYIYLLIFGFISWLSQFIGLRLISGTFISVFSFRNLFLEPFLANHQYIIACALWFVPALFCGLVLVAICKPILRACRKSLSILALSIAACVLIYYICVSINSYMPYKFRFVARNIIGFVYIVFGYLYYNSFLQKLDVRMVLAASLAIYFTIVSNHGHIYFSMFNNDYISDTIRIFSLPTSLAGIMIILSFSRIIAGSQTFINKTGFIALGRGSYHIMAIHLSCFTLLSCILCWITGTPLSEIDSPYYCFPRCIPLYFIFGIAGSYWYLQQIKKIREHPWNRIVGFWTSDPRSNA